jgi:hypothetical protein
MIIRCAFEVALIAPVMSFDENAEVADVIGLPSRSRRPERDRATTAVAN